MKTRLRTNPKATAVHTLSEAHELMALARSGAVGPVPVKEVPMGGVQVWIDELRAGKIVGRIILAGIPLIQTWRMFHNRPLREQAAVTHSTLSR